MMKNYKSIKNFYEAMQQKPQHPHHHTQRQRQHLEKEPELSLKKIIDFFKGSKP
jgi:hypothetical protein